MQVIAVPSIVDKAAYQGCQCTTLPSLLDLRPAELGLPAFEDFVNGTVPLEHPWRIKGTVVKGFGRGSKVCATPRMKGTQIINPVHLSRLPFCTQIASFCNQWTAVNANLLAAQNTSPMCV